MELSLPMRKMAGRVVLGEIKVPIYFCFCAFLFLVLSILIHFYLFFFFFPFLCPCLKPAAKNQPLGIDKYYMSLRAKEIAVSSGHVFLYQFLFKRIIT